MMVCEVGENAHKFELHQHVDCFVCFTGQGIPLFESLEQEEAELKACINELDGDLDFMSKGRGHALNPTCPNKETNSSALPTTRNSPGHPGGISQFHLVQVVNSSKLLHLRILEQIFNSQGCSHGISLSICVTCSIQVHSF